MSYSCILSWASSKQNCSRIVKISRNFATALHSYGWDGTDAYEEASPHKQRTARDCASPLPLCGAAWWVYAATPHKHQSAGDERAANPELSHADVWKKKTTLVTHQSASETAFSENWNSATGDAINWGTGAMPKKLRHVVWLLGRRDGDGW